MTQQRLALRHLKFGKIDARNEVLTRDKATLEHFLESFISPTGLTLDEFVKGERSFVHGMKGSGKTALLRYLQLHVQDDKCLTKFVSFATDISDTERNRLYRDSGIDIYEEAKGEITGECVNIWIIFIFRQLVKIIEENKISFSSHHNIKVFCELIKNLYDGEEQSVMSWLVGRLKQGKYKIKTKNFEANFEPSKANEEKDYSLDIIIQQCFLLLKELSWEGHKRIYIFFDELNLSFSSKAKHRRDATLIRDLIVAVDRVNSFFIEEEKPIFVLAAIRSEVLNAISVPTNEINKLLRDKGRELHWFSPTARHPAIVDLFARKIQASEKLRGYPVSQNVFENYFQRGVFGFGAEQLIVELTWCNPRDIVILFGEAVKAATTEFYFGETLLNRALEPYSAEAWREKVEELGVEYAPVEIQSIKKTLLIGRKYFKIDQFEKALRDKAHYDQNIKNLESKRKPSKILEDLYRVGIIGQSSREPLERGQATRQFSEHWLHRGHSSFDVNAWMVVHKALWHELRLGRIQPNPGYDRG